jgi:hypothetical protein
MKATIDFLCITCNAVAGEPCKNGQPTFHLARILDAINTNMNNPSENPSLLSEKKGVPSVQG